MLWAEASREHGKPVFLSDPGYPRDSEDAGGEDAGLQSWAECCGKVGLSDCKIPQIFLELPRFFETTFTATQAEASVSGCVSLPRSPRNGSDENEFHLESQQGLLLPGSCSCAGQRPRLFNQNQPR